MVYNTTKGLRLIGTELRTGDAWIECITYHHGANYYVITRRCAPVPKHKRTWMHKFECRTDHVKQSLRPSWEGRY